MSSSSRKAIAERRVSHATPPCNRGRLFTLTPFEGTVKEVHWVDASNNYWGGGPPADAADVAVSGNVTFNAPAHLTTDPAR